MEALGQICIVLLIYTFNQVTSNPVTQYVISNGQNAKQNLPPAAVLPQNTLKTLKSEMSSGPLDSNVLNNLAIALQLLIVSNLMNMPVDTERLKQKYELQAPKYEKYEAMPLSLEQALKVYSTKPYYETLPSYEQKQNFYERLIPNANFVGSTGFSDPVLGSISSVKPNPRASMTLMSPYDALGTSSFDISFPSSYSKKDFQSPYASVLAADSMRDLFSF